MHVVLPHVQNWILFPLHVCYHIHFTNISKAVSEIYNVCRSITDSEISTCYLLLKWIPQFLFVFVTVYATLVVWLPHICCSSWSDLSLAVKLANPVGCCMSLDFSLLYHLMPVEGFIWLPCTYLLQSVWSRTDSTTTMAKLNGMQVHAATHSPATL